MRIRSAAAVVIAALLCLPSGAVGAPQDRDPQRGVVGGQDASEPYEFMVSVQRTDGGHFCGGSLLRRTWVLTAAHCVDDRAPDEVQVMLGSHERSAPGVVIAVRDIVVHERYTGEGYDIALLRLTAKAPFKPIKIAGKKQQSLWAPGEPARVIGWGSSIFLVGPGSETLQEVDVPIVDDADCARAYGAFFGFEDQTQICAGEDTGMKDACQGDSGGPLMVKDPKKSRWYQVGTVSYGLGCGTPLFYGVYGRVAGDSLRDWIEARLPKK